MGNADTKFTSALGAKAVKPGSPELRHLIDAIAAGAEARDRGEGSTHDAIALVRASKLGLFRQPVSHGGGGVSRTGDWICQESTTRAINNRPMDT